MANKITVQTGVVNKSLAASVACQESTFRENTNKDYKDAFKQKINGYEVGDSFEIPKPAIYDAMDGKVDGTDTTGKTAAFKEEKITVEVNSNPLLAPTFTDKELTFELDRDSKEGLARLTLPVGEALNEKSESNGARIYSEQADAVEIVDVAPTNFKNIFGDLKIKLVEAGAKGEIISIIDERMMVILSRELEEKFNPVKKVEEAFNGKFYSYNDISFAKAVSVPTHVSGAGGDTFTLAADYVEGAVTMQVTAIGSLVVGDILDLGVAQVNQRRKDVLVFNATRVIKAISGTTITISPIYFTGNSLKNVNAAGFSAGDTFDALGTKTKVYKVYPVYMKKAWGYINIQQPDLDALDEVKVKPIKGMYCRFFSWVKGETAVVGQRAETLEAWFAIRSEFMGSVRVQSTLVK